MSQNADPESYKIASDLQVRTFLLLTASYSLTGTDLHFPSVLNKDDVTVLHNFVDMLLVSRLTVGCPESK